MNKIEELVEAIGGTPWAFYRAIYKSTSGPTIGFKINGEWVYCSDLPNTSGIHLEGISICGYVEGSEVELETRRFDENDFTKEDWWNTVAEVEKEVSFYWVRDNSSWFWIRNKDGDTIADGHWESFDNAPKIQWDEDAVDPSEIQELLTFILENADAVTSLEDEEEIECGNFLIVGYLNDSTYD